MPVDVRLSPFRQIAPVVTVVRREDATGRRLPGLPLLVVEVQSSSTRAIDLALTRQVLQQAVYVEVDRGTSITMQQPFPVTVLLA